MIIIVPLIQLTKISNDKDVVTEISKGQGETSLLR